MLIFKVAEPLYNLRSKGKMATIDNLAENALVVTDTPGGSSGKNVTRNNEYAARMEQEMES